MRMRPGRALSLAWLALAAALWVCALPARAWVYPEHRDIAVAAVTGLDSARRETFDRLWQLARVGALTRMCANGADGGKGLTPGCIDWSALSAIAGDHSCSSAEMVDQVRRADWILVVADIAAQLKEDLARAPFIAPPEPARRAPGVIASARRTLADEHNRARRLNALHASDTRLQRADPRYATRADANLAHFLLPRSDTRLDPLAYAAQALAVGAPLNAAGVYVWFHLSALQKADRLAHANLSDDERSALARAALADEAFALHFLQDMFSAGHIAGSWGDVSQRKGTHDFYNQNGLEAFRWRAREHSVVVMGDAHMPPDDLKLTAETVRASLSQVLDAADGKLDSLGAPHVVATSVEPDDFDVCTAKVFPDRSDRLGAGLARYRPALEAVLLDTLIPGLSAGLGAQPRSRSELGTFIGLVGSIEGRRINRGFEESQNGAGTLLGIDMGVRAGLGLEGALGDGGDGLAFVQLGYRADGTSSNRLASDVTGGGNFYAAIPARSGLSLRLRAPYYLVPGDLLLASPLYLLSPDTYTNMAVTASNGGLSGLQQGYATGIGRFQFVLGRELGVTWYGLDGKQQLIVPTPPPNGSVLQFRSVAFDLPILEYRPFRSFSADQSSTLLIQLVVGWDKPYGVSVEGAGGGPTPILRPVRWFGLRMTFDWRHYR